MQAVILDMDGTLYDQRRLRLTMIAEMLRFAVTSRDGLLTMRTIKKFRESRERLASELAAGASEAQFRQVADALGIGQERVVSIVNEWIHRRPLKHIYAARRAGVVEFFNAMQRRGTRVAVLSDYDPKEKLRVLELNPDILMHSLQHDEGYLKPHPFGLRLVLERLGVDAASCVMIGDRDDHDGGCSRAAGVPFLLCDKPNFFVELLRRTQLSL